jgi:DNA anti-recombination protein RmuC
MNKKLILAVCMVFMVGFCFSAVLCNAQQSEGEIAKNQQEKVVSDLESANKEVLDSDLQSEKEALEAQTQAQQDADVLHDNIDNEVSAATAQANQDADKKVESISKEELAHMEKAIQESDQANAELNAEVNKIKAEMPPK